MPVPQTIQLITDSVKVVTQQLQQTTLTLKKQSVFSGCDVSFMQSRKVQVAELTGMRDTTIRFEQGTKIIVRPSDFASERTGQPIAGLVKLQVAEYYDMTDILLQNLSTTTNDGLLETNGMINVQVFAANGEACKLKKDGTMNIRFPQKNNRPGMQLFNGVKKEDGTIIWEPLLLHASVVTSGKKELEMPTPADTKKPVMDTFMNTIPVFAGGLAGIEKILTL